MPARAERAMLVSSKRPIGPVVAIAAIGLVLTAALAARVERKPGLYYSEIRVGFHGPVSKHNPNNQVTPSESVISVAGVVARMVRPNPPAGQVVSPTVTLADQGIRQGWSVSLPNDGGQFTNNFDQALLQVQAVGSDRSEVRQKVQSLVATINADLRTLQNQTQVPAVDRISTSLSPRELQVFRLSGSRPRALGAVLVLGVGGTLTAEMLYARRRNGRVATAQTAERLLDPDLVA
jgi:hypothetical protein